MKRVGFIILLLLLLVVLIGQEIKLYPNPVRSDGNLHIESVDSLLPPVIKVYDMSGRLVLQKDIGYGNKSYVINISRLSKGAYIVILEDYKKR